MENMHFTHDELARRFNFHPPQDEATKDAHQVVRSTCLNAAVNIVGATGPMSREQSLAITKLEEAMFWANAAIAREISAPRGDGPSM